VDGADTSPDAREILDQSGASSAAAGRVVSAVMPPEINHDRSMVGRKHAVNRISRENNRLNVDQLILVAGAEKDMVDALVDQIRTGL
jgi:hypothetical protein